MSSDEPTSQAVASMASSLTHVHNSDGQLPEPVYSPGHGDSAFSEDKVEEAVENLEEDWENDPDNARNWSFRRKWTAVGIVRFVNPGHLLFFLRTNL